MFCSSIVSKTIKMFHQFPPTSNKRHLVDRKHCIYLQGFYRRDFVTSKRAQHCCMLHVSSFCTPCCMFVCLLLHVVGTSCCAKFETGHTFNYLQTDATTPTLMCQKCWPRCVTTLKRLCSRLINPLIAFSQKLWCLAHNSKMVYHAASKIIHRFLCKKCPTSPFSV